MRSARSTRRRRKCSSTRCCRRFGRCAASDWRPWDWPYKGDTDDIRESPAIDMIKKLLDAGATVTAYDPAARERAQAVLPPSERMIYAGDLYEASKDADAALILTDWKEFADIDLVRLNKSVKFP